MLTEAHAHIMPPRGLHLSAESAPAPDRTRDERWVCIWTRDTLRASALSLVGEPERSAAVLLEPAESAPIIVFGTVLPWRGDQRHAVLRGGAAFAHSLDAQETDVSRLRAERPDARFWFLGDLNQEVEKDGPVGTALGRHSLRRFLDRQHLTALTGNRGDPLRSRGWRDSIDHIIVDAASASRAAAPSVWPGTFPLPGAPWPDHHGVEVSLAAV